MKQIEYVYGMRYLKVNCLRSVLVVRVARVCQRVGQRVGQLVGQRVGQRVGRGLARRRFVAAAPRAAARRYIRTRFVDLSFEPSKR